MKKLLLLVLTCLLSASVSAQERPLWMRYCAISPDGKTIVFSYKGDLFTVPVTGGAAKQLTTNPAYDSNPVWSPDGSKIAFASDREDCTNVWIVSKDGGEPKQITTSSHFKTILTFTDNDHVLFSMAEMPSRQSIIPGMSKFPQIYEVSVNGGRIRMYNALPMADININRKTGDILYHDIKGSEDMYRKHHKSPVCRDIWMLSKGKYTKLTDFEGEDRTPVWTADGKGYYYLSERDGNFNVWFRSLDGAQNVQITQHKTNPVRFLTASADGTLCYGYDGEIYTVRQGGKSQRVNISIVSDRSDRELIPDVLTKNATEICTSPSGKEVAFIVHGEVYVTSVDYKTTIRITDTPEMERNLSFSPDGRSIAYASERGGCWNIYRASIKNKDEKQFAYATDIVEEQLTKQNHTSLYPRFSPDGKEIAFFEDRGTIRIINLASKQVRTVMDGKNLFSYSDGDIDFEWSPDSRWLLASYYGDGGYHHDDIALIDASGKQKPYNLTNSAYVDFKPHWALGGKAMLFKSNRRGYKNHGGHGYHSDFFIMFFDIDAYERFMMNKEEKALYDETHKPAKKSDADGDKKSADKKSADKKPAAEPLKFDLENCRDRVVRLTAPSTRLGDGFLTPKGDTLIYEAAFEDSYDLYRYDLLEDKNELLQKEVGRGDLQPDKKFKNLFVLSKGGIKKIEIAKGKRTNVDFEAQFNYRPYAERKHLFEHIWRQVDDKFYRADLHGVDWAGYKKVYEKFLPYINNEYDFRDMLAEMLGELNASHTGARYYDPVRYRTASLGLFYDESYKGDGLKIAEVVKGSPLAVRNTGVKAGDIIEAIDGTPIKKGEDFYPLLSGKTGKLTRLTINGKNINVRPISLTAYNNLLYDRWVERNRRMVDSLSGGKIAYVHISSMNGEKFRKLYEEILNEDNRERDAVIVDERHNGGGYLHDDLCHLLNGKQHSHFIAHGKYLGVEPSTQWIKPSCVVLCEDDYSNACGFPRQYQDMKIGKLIGAPVAGTSTSVWWETLVNDIVFGIPQVGRVDVRGDYGENTQLNPDIVVYNSPEDYLTGRDRQLERAVQEMLKEGAAFKEQHKHEFGGHKK